MQVTYLGHAGYSIATRSRHFLVDPTLTPTWQCGTVESSPRRALHLERLPRPDAVIITHQHPGHLELRTLALLSRDTHVFYPGDPAIDLAVRELGFEARTVVEPGMEIAFDGGRLVITRSVARGPLVGALFEEDDGSSCWIMDDQGAPLEEVAAVRAMAPRLGLLVCHYPANSHHFFERFQLEEHLADELRHSLDGALAARPSLVAPNCCGFRYLGDADWLNRYIFPMSPARFLAELAALAPEQPSADLAPGDVVSIDGRRAAVRRQASPFVRALGPREGTLFDPTAALPPLADPNPERLSRRELERRTEAFLTGDLLAWLREGALCAGSRLELYHRIGLTSRVFVVYPEGPEESFLLRLGPGEPTVLRDAAPPDEQAPANVRIAASVLDRWRRAEMPFYWARYHCRTFGAAYATGLLRSGRAEVKALGTVDLLSEHLRRPELLHRWIRREIASIREGRS